MKGEREKCWNNAIDTYQVISGNTCLCCNTSQPWLEKPLPYQPKSILCYWKLKNARFPEICIRYTGGSREEVSQRSTNYKGSPLSEK